MAIAYLKFEDDGADGAVTVSGGTEGALERGSAAHMIVLRLSQQPEMLNQLIAALPPVSFSDEPQIEIAE